MRDGQPLALTVEDNMSDIDYDFHQFVDLLKQTADNLKKMNEMQRAMRWQYGGTDLPEFADFKQELEEAQDGWISSAC